MTDPIEGPWQESFYPCAEGCGFVGSATAFLDGSCYRPCPNCGGPRTRRTGRLVYCREPIRRWLPFLKRTRVLRVEWRDEV